MSITPEQAAALRMTAPLPNCFSMPASAISSARFLSVPSSLAGMVVTVFEDFLPLSLAILPLLYVFALQP